ncbi:signal peptidase I [Allorhizocola rhizosphaerae]|uniref:signal peptidase I n=1 Tax=Allorhizocola rhizosphaerae TaxID=1872709 RepID=UPI000E3BA846|nr:signal peptidase I [Allorhizocola rhizosphaerae]
MTWVLLAIAGLAAAAVVVLVWLRRTWLVVTVTGTSMKPTLDPGDRVLVRRAALRRVRAGQIVVVDADDPELIIKRVAAMPGDAVPPELARLGSRVPADRLILLGDNPEHSMDSRRRGYYEAAGLLGVIVRRLPTQR